MFNFEILYARQIESVLAGVQQHPHLPRRCSGKNTRKHGAAAHAGVMLCYLRTLKRASAIKRQVVMRSRGGRRRTACARLYPEVYSKGYDSSRFSLGKLKCCLDSLHWTPAPSSNGLPDDLITALRRDTNVSLEHAAGSGHHACLNCLIAFCFFESHGAPRKVDWRIVA